MSNNIRKAFNKHCPLGRFPNRLQTLAIGYKRLNTD